MQKANLDRKNRDTALDPKQSFIVQAPAGSGKTSLLIQRLLILLTTVESPEECLAITFTRKAAAEMRTRILQALERAKDSTPPTDGYEKKIWELAQAVLERDKLFSWDLLHNPNRLKIKTIDAFCASLTRQMPIVSEFGVAINIVEDASEFYKLAARNLLKALETNVQWSEAVHMLLNHLDNNLALAEGLLANMLSHRDQWLPYVGYTFSTKNARHLLECGLQWIIQDTLLLLHASIPPECEEILSLARSAAEQLKLLKQEGKKTASPILHCQYLSTTWPGSELQDLSLWQGLGELLLTRDNAWRKTVTAQQGFLSPAHARSSADKAHLKALKERMGYFLEKCQQYPEFRAHLEEMRHCPPPAYTEEQWQIVQALIQLLPVLIAELTVVFQANASVDFTEITLAALKALGDSDTPTDLALGLDYKIHHILMDEFQDTSRSQFRLLEQLIAGWQPNDGRTLFLVGDPMQSIYRFRQAEVGLFIQAKQKGVGTVALKPLTLTANFRSDPKIVGWINTLFKFKFPREHNMTSGAIAFNCSEAVQMGSTDAVADLQVVTPDTENEIVLQIIRKIRKAYPSASIALLVRSRRHLQTILPVLRETEIHYQGIELERLTEQPIVQDLLVLTRSLLHLGDRIAWLSLLRTPWIQLPLADLLVIANFDDTLPLWYALQNYMLLQSLSREAMNKLAVIVPIVSHALLNTQRLPLRAWVTETWRALGGENALGYADSVQAAQTFLAILEENRNFYEVGALERRVQSLYAKSPTIDPNAVQIMTIHKAKGLEFDVVIAMGIGRQSMTDPEKLLLWEERVSPFRDSYFVLAPIKSAGSKQDAIYHFLKRQEAHRARYEAMRLEYVAATRARQKLYWLTHREP